MLRRLFKETLIYGLSRYISKLISVFLLPLYTAVLLPEDYGILNLLGTITVVSTFLIVSGTDSALGYYYYRKEFFNQRNQMVSSSLWLRLIFSAAAFLIILLCSNLLSNLLFGKDYSLFVIITGATVVFSSVSSLLFDLIRFEIRPWVYTIISTGGILLNICLSIYYVLLLKNGVHGALTASMYSYMILFLVTIIYVFRRYGFGFSYYWFKQIFNYGFPLIGTGVAVWVLNSTDVYFLAHYSSLSSVGIYSVGAKVASFIGLLAGAVQIAWGPFAGDIQFEADAKKIYAKVFLIYGLINITGIFFISMFAVDILKVFTQPDYYGAKAVIPLLCLSTVISSGYFIAVTGMHLSKKLQHTIWISVGAAVFNIMLNFILTPKFGPVGAALSVTLSNSLIFFLTMMISQKQYYIPYRYSRILFVFLPAVLLIAVAYYFSLSITSRIIISGFYFLSIVYFFYRNFSQSEEFKKILNKINSLRTPHKPEDEVTNLEV